MQQINEMLNIIEPNLLTPDQISELLPLLDELDAWIKQVKEYALNSALNGNEIPGFKLVEGRSIRKWLDENNVRNVLKENGYDLKTFEEVKLISPSKAETLIGKKAFSELLSSEVDKGQGKPTLVPNSDKRQALNISNVSFKDFEE